MPSDLQPLLDHALDLGARAAKLIDPASVVTAAWVRWKCRYGCGGYGSSLCCPPHSPTPAETRELLDCYTRAILVHCAPPGDPRSVVIPLEREAFLAGFYRAFALGEGPCRLCDKCSLERCSHPREARPAMEACGIDVFSTARAHGLPINVVTSRDCEQNYYGLLLID